MTEKSSYAATERISGMCQILEILLELHPDVDFLSHTKLVDDNIIDSFSVITLVAEINDRFDCSIPAEELVPENFNSYAGIKALVTKLTEE